MLKECNVVSPQQLMKIVEHAVVNDFPLLVKGRIGSGKTQICSEGARNAIGNPENVIIESPHLKDIPDYTGLAFAVQNGGDVRADFLPISTIRTMLNATEPTVFIFDELDKARLSGNAIAQIIFGRNINNHTIPKCVRFLATCNLPEEQTGSSPIRPHLLDRWFSVVELRLREDDWTNYILTHYKEKGIMMSQFIQMKPEYLTNGQNTDLALKIEKTPTGRSLESYLKMDLTLNSHNEAELEPMLAGCCGDAFHIEYQAFKRLFTELPTFKEIVHNPMEAEVPHKPQQLALRFCLIGMLSQKIELKTVNPVCQYLSRPEWKDFSSLKRVFIENVKILKPDVFKSGLTEWFVELLD